MHRFLCLSGPGRPDARTDPWSPPREASVRLAFPQANRPLWRRAESGRAMCQAFLASYLIGLREGLEMVLVVSILVAYLVRTGRRRQLVPVWLGVGAAVVVLAGFGWLLTLLSFTALYRPEHPLFDAITSAGCAGLRTRLFFL